MLLFGILREMLAARAGILPLKVGVMCLEGSGAALVEAGELSRRCCWMSFAPEGMGVRRAKLCRLGKLQEQGNLGNIPWSHLT